MKNIFTDKISRIVSAIVIVLIIAFAVRCSIQVVNYGDSINNPANEEFVVEVAFNLDIPVDSVTQEQFNARYLAD